MKRSSQFKYALGFGCLLSLLLAGCAGSKEAEASPTPAIESATPHVVMLAGTPEPTPSPTPAPTPRAADAAAPARAPDARRQAQAVFAAAGLSPADCVSPVDAAQPANASDTAASRLLFILRPMIYAPFGSG